MYNGHHKIVTGLLHYESLCNCINTFSWFGRKLHLQSLHYWTHSSLLRFLLKRLSSSCGVDRLLHRYLTRKHVYQSGVCVTTGIARLVLTIPSRLSWSMSATGAAENVTVFGGPWNTLCRKSTLYPIHYAWFPPWIISFIINNSFVLLPFSWTNAHNVGSVNSVMTFSYYQFKRNLTYQTSVLLPEYCAQTISPNVLLFSLY